MAFAVYFKDLNLSPDTFNQVGDFQVDYTLTARNNRANKQVKYHLDLVRVTNEFFRLVDGTGNTVTSLDFSDKIETTYTTVTGTFTLRVLKLPTLPARTEQVRMVAYPENNDKVRGKTEILEVRKV
jgi:hypothetical protein